MTPTVLMLSGIGPKGQLRKHKIPVQHDACVGSNLLDHIYTLIFFEFDPTPTDALAGLDNIYTVSQTQAYRHYVDMSTLKNRPNSQIPN